MGSLADDLRHELHENGFDVFAPMCVSWYNDYLKKLGLATDSTSYLSEAGEQHASGEAPFKLRELPDFGRQGNALALIIGNSRAMWPHFLRWLSTQPEHMLKANPVDTFAINTISRAIGNHFDGISSDTFWASEMSPERLVDMNRAALVSHLCYFSDDMYLSIHPQFGSWVAFRCVCVFDLPADLGPPPAHFEPLLTPEEAFAAREAFAEALRASSNVELNTDGMPLELAHKWAAMRDCVSLGREHKYSALQSEYHYTKDARVLVQAMARLAQGEKEQE